MSQQDTTEKKTYDDISYEKRKQLIYLINEEKWTIKAAAQELSIKLCTAKYILYLYRKEGKIYRKKGESSSISGSSQGQNGDARKEFWVAYMPCCVLYVCTPDQIPISLGDLVSQ